MTDRGRGQGTAQRSRGRGGYLGSGRHFRQGFESIQSIADRLRTLKHSYLSRNERDLLTQRLGSVLFSSKITNLNLSNCFSGDTGIILENLAAALRNNFTLTSLNLSSNGICFEDYPGCDCCIPGYDYDSDGCSYYCSSKEKRPVKGFVDFFTTLAENSTLTNLNLSDNDISGDGVKAIAKALHGNIGLKILNLSKCGTHYYDSDNESVYESAMNAERLLEALEANSTLTTLVLTEGWFDEAIVTRINDHLRRNRKNAKKQENRNNKVSEGNSQMKLKIKQLEGEVAKLRTERDKISSKHVKIAAERDQLSAERDQLSAERDELSVEVGKINRYYRMQVASCHEAQKSAADLQKKLDSAVEKLENSSTLVAQLQEENAFAENLSAALKVERDQLSQKVQQLQGQNLELLSLAQLKVLAEETKSKLALIEKRKDILF
eukprot:TRINITY_DN22581_c0_g1_i2.p1 TRINITY_DN22581_c0_g1~~TRINITY_DN22581_c0_g1_i2.p1  ORF type:complete len:436 (+),score=64.22 TRINITY_DN22581_c0_g1_i2:135-1442(+)